VPSSPEYPARNQADNGGKPKLERAKTRAFPSIEPVEKGRTQRDLSIEVGKSPLVYRHRSLIEGTQKVMKTQNWFDSQLVDMMITIMTMNAVFIFHFGKHCLESQILL
jgi:hypothetical protein